jgi:hypothetical protein
MTAAKKIVDAYLKLDATEQGKVARAILRALPDATWTHELETSTKRIQASAKRTGASKLTMRQINAEIAATRRERRVPSR